MLASLSLLSLLSLLHLPASLGQTSDAVCLPYYKWTSNSQKKTPCEVAASLIAVCNGGTFDVLPLEEGQHYQGPTTVATANNCMCNTVTYSLMTACGLCQGRNTLRWSEWSTNCPNVTFNKFPDPLPTGIRVPAWAFNDVKEKDTFDQFLAKDNSNGTESTAIPAPTSASQPEALAASTTSDTSSSVESATPTAEAAEAEGPKPNLKKANRIGGAVVGALLGSATIAAGVLLYLRCKRRASRVRVEKPEAETYQA